MVLKLKESMVCETREVNLSSSVGVRGSVFEPRR